MEDSREIPRALGDDAGRSLWYTLYTSMRARGGMETRIPMRVESNELAASPVYKD